jgi:hypothetical protein
MNRALLTLALAGCASDFGKAMSFDGGTGADSPVGNPCIATLSFNPSPAHSGATIRAAATVTNAQNIPAFQWQVRFNNADVMTTQAATDGSQIDFFAATPGPYDVALDLGFASGCDPVSTMLNVGAPGANVADYRIHVVPPSDLAPAQDTIVEVDGGADANRPIALDPGLTPSLRATDNGGNGIPAYVKFISTTSPSAFVEAFAMLDGTFQPRLLGQPYTALVVPVSSSFAPTLVSWSPGTLDLPAQPGQVVNGTVKDGAGVAIAGAVVQLSSTGIPSTTAITASNGSFSVRETFVTGAVVTVDVTAPAARGLPRLTASGLFDLTQPLPIQYAASLATCNLSGTAVARGGVNQPGAVVTAVGTIASAGTIAGTAATGNVQLAGTADGAGHLPSMLVPKVGMSAVVQLSASDYSVVVLNQTACNTNTIAAPANVVAAGTITDAAQTALAGAILEASPTRELAAAGVPASQVMTSSSGQFSLALAAGGYYDLRFSDPLGRAALVTTPDTNAVPTTQALGSALHLTGTVNVVGNPNPVQGAAIQVLCSNCTGLAAQRPIADAATDAASMFRLAVPDPGIGM